MTTHAHRAHDRHEPEGVVVSENAVHSTEKVQVEFLGLTHECADPNCHVAGFVETLGRTEETDLTDAELAALSLARVLALAEGWAGEQADPSDPRIRYRRECARLVEDAIRNPLTSPTTTDPRATARETTEPEEGER